jgi:uncharacterized protein
LKQLNQALRAAYLAAGLVSLGIAAVGLVVPLLPATPFLLLAAACFARSSQRFYGWLLDHRIFGPLVREWRQHRSIPWRTKLVAIGLMSATLAASVAFFVTDTDLQGALAALGVLLAESNF